MSTKNEKYLNSITEAGKELAKESEGSMATYVLDKLKSSGAKHFVKNVGDDKELTHIEAMESEFLNTS